MHLFLFAFFLSCCPAIAAQAEPKIQPIAYWALEMRLNQKADFEGIRIASIAKLNVSEPILLPGATIGERFNGQKLGRFQNFDSLIGAATAPLKVVAGAAKNNLSIAYHSALNSDVIRGEGPLGFPEKQSAAEGAISIEFAQPQFGFGFRYHAERRTQKHVFGVILVTFHRSDGTPIQKFRLPLESKGYFGFVRSQEIADIAGVSLTNTDPGGVSFDDFVYHFDGALLF